MSSSARTSGGFRSAGWKARLRRNRPTGSAAGRLVSKA